MSTQDDVAVVRTFTDAMRSGDIRACLALVDPDLVFSEAQSLPFGGDYKGKEGFVQLLRNVSRDFEVELGTPDIVGDDGLVAVNVRGTMTSRATGRSMEMDVVDVYRVREGKVARVDVYYKDTTAVTELCHDGVGGDR